MPRLFVFVHKMAESVQLTSPAAFCPVPVGWLSYLIGASKPYNYKHLENCTVLGYYAASSSKFLPWILDP